MKTISEVIHSRELVTAETKVVFAVIVFAANCLDIWSLYDAI